METYLASLSGMATATARLFPLCICHFSRALQAAALKMYESGAPKPL